MEIALAQLEIEAGKPHANRTAATTAIAEAADRGADLVVLPELFTVGYFAFDSYVRQAEPLDGETLTTIAEVAASEEIAVLAGSIVEDLAASHAAGFDTPTDEGEDATTPNDENASASGGYANTAVCFDASGTRQGVYRKHHLFGYESAEQELLTPGESLATVEIGGFTAGITTCYDLRFPELYRRLVDRGVTLVLVPSAWPYPRVEHWRLFGQVRAVENLCYVATANGVGEFEAASLCGRSAVYDPWGTQIASLGTEAGLVTARIDPETVSRRREEFPALADRRLSDRE